METHTIESIMNATMENIRDMVDVNTVIGEPVTANDGTTVIPISRVCFGFVAGGGEFEMSGKKPAQNGGQNGSGQNGSGQNGQAGQAAKAQELPFAGGASAGVSVSPVGFLVINSEQVRLLPVQHYAPLDRIIELAPQVVCDIKRWMEKKKGGQSPASQMPPSSPLD